MGEGFIMLRNMTTIYIINDDKVLLLYRIGSKVLSSPSWCGIGGHFEENELNNPKACVLRELSEETQIEELDLKDIKLKYITLRNKNDEIRQNYYFFANLKNKNLDITKYNCNEGKLEWMLIKEAMQMDMPYTAKYCFKHYFDIGKNTDAVFAGIATEYGIDFVKLKDF